MIAVNIAIAAGVAHRRATALGCMFQLVVVRAVNVKTVS
jgi:hypothetical protein